ASEGQPDLAHAPETPDGGRRLGASRSQLSPRPSPAGRRIPGPLGVTWRRKEAIGDIRTHRGGGRSGRGLDGAWASPGAPRQRGLLRLACGELAPGGPELLGRRERTRSGRGGPLRVGPGRPRRAGRLDPPLARRPRERDRPEPAEPWHHAAGL